MELKDCKRSVSDIRRGSPLNGEVLEPSEHVLIHLRIFRPHNMILQVCEEWMNGQSNEG